MQRCALSLLKCYPRSKYVIPMTKHVRASQHLRWFSDTTDISAKSGNEDTQVNDILDQGSQPLCHPAKVAEHLSSLSKIKSSVEDLLDDPRFQKIVSVLEGNNTGKISIFGVISCLKSLENLKGLPPSSLLVANLENTLLWRARTAQVRELTHLLSFVHTRKDREGQMTLLKEIVKALERRWVEVTDGKSFVGILHYPDCFTEQFLNKMDDRIIDVAESLSAEELVMILSKKGEKHQRSVPVLKSLCFHLRQNVKELNLRDISNCFFALNRLSYKDLELLDALCDRIDLSKTETNTLSCVRSILTSCGQMKYLNMNVMNDITKFISDRLDELSSKDLVAFLMTAASVNYVPQNSEDIFNAISERVTYETLKQDKSGGELIWLDVVWSLSVLEKQNTSQLSSVLSSDFFNKLLYSHDHRNVGAILKVLNLNTVAKYIHPDYKGPLIDVLEDPLLRDVKATPSFAKNKFLELVLNDFSSLAASPAMANIKVNTGLGFVCDAECVFDAKSKPLPIKDFSRLGKADKDLKYLPAGSQRVALMTVSYHDCTTSGSLSGLHALNKRLLEAIGFKVLVITHRDIQPQQSKINRVKVLESKLLGLLQSGSVNT